MAIYKDINRYLYKLLQYKTIGKALYDHLICICRILLIIITPAVEY